MKITKEIAYKYIKERGIMGKYTNDFNIVEIFTESLVPGPNYLVDEHPVVRCEYTEGATTFHTRFKNVHIDLLKFNEWIISNRENQLNELGI
jgi:hypothetical protein